VPYFEFFENEQESLEKVPANHPIVVICAKGGASDFVAAMLEEEGIRAVNLSDGMIGWGN
jgi:rhodanese-related sulfurtransferase